MHIFRLSAALSSEGEIKAWSIWHGYFFAMINQYSIDDFIFVSTLLGFAWSLYVMWTGNIREWFYSYSVLYIHRRGDDGCQPLAQDIEAPAKNEKS
jgi:hypothetical protein